MNNLVDRLKDIEGSSNDFKCFLGEKRNYKVSVSQVNFLHTLPQYCLLSTAQKISKFKNMKNMGDPGKFDTFHGFHEFTSQSFLE